MKWIKEITNTWVFPVFMAFLVTLVVRGFLINVNMVEGVSMETSLSTGDILLCRKVGLSDIDRGDIITATLDGHDELIIKRVIGLPGETVVMDNDGFIYVNGVKLQEYQQETPGLGNVSVQLADDEYFVLGDNRFDSYDSRYFGALRQENIRDVVMLRFFPFTVY